MGSQDSVSWWRKPFSRAARAQEWTLALRNEVVQLQDQLQMLGSKIQHVNDLLIDFDVGGRRNLRSTLDRLSVQESARLVERYMLDAVSFPHPHDTLRHALSIAPASGMALEFGVFRGNTLRVIDQARSNGAVYGFDSFQGLPEAWRAGFPAGAFGLDRLPDVGRAELIVGWFNQTLPAFLEAHQGPVDFLHVDCDLYSSTRTVLAHVGPRLRSGSVVLFDEFFNYPGWQQHEYKAWLEYVDETGIKYAYEAYTYNNEQVALRILD